MSKKFHVNDKGIVGECKATVKECPIGEADTEHYPTEQAARAAYEEKQSHKILKNLRQYSSTGKNIRKKLRNATLFGGALLTTISLSACNTDDLIDIAEETGTGTSTSQSSDDGGYTTEDSTSSEDSSTPTASEVPYVSGDVYFQGKTLTVSQAEYDQAQADLANLITQPNDENAPYDRAEQYGRSFQTGVVGRLEHRDIPEATFKNDEPQARAIGGSFVDPYTGETVEVIKGSSQDTNVDHIVPLKAVSERQNKSNPMDEETRKEIANDPDNLQVVGAIVNKEKSDSTIDEFVPSYEPSQCRYAISTINVYTKYSENISPTDSETATMKEILDTRCDIVG